MLPLGCTCLDLELVQAIISITQDSIAAYWRTCIDVLGLPTLDCPTIELSTYEVFQQTSLTVEETTLGTYKNSTAASGFQATFYVPTVTIYSGSRT